MRFDPPQEKKIASIRDFKYLIYNMKQRKKIKVLFYFYLFLCVIEDLIMLPVKRGYCVCIGKGCSEPGSFSRLTPQRDGKRGIEREIER